MSVSLNERKNGYLCKSSICGSKVISRVPELYYYELWIHCGSTESKVITVDLKL